MAKELIPLVLDIGVWELYLEKTWILLQSDNLSSVTTVNKGSCKATVVTHLLRCMWYFVVNFDVDIVFSRNSANEELQLCTAFIRPFIILTVKPFFSSDSILSKIGKYTEMVCT